jgi:glyoxylase-like metal-dependent hydrolase (beta-lactamase superfamily II)
VMHTPGHAPTCIPYLIDHAVFVGDTLIMPHSGAARSGFSGGDGSSLGRSIRRILDLPLKTGNFVGLDYPPDRRSHVAWETAVDEERARNVLILDGGSEADFVALRRAGDTTLAPPVVILSSLQVNIRAGALPPKTQMAGST